MPGTGILFFMNPTKLFTDFFNSEKASGIVLIVCTAISLLVANYLAGEGYFAFWHEKVGFSAAGIELRMTVEHWINDGLMALFFLLVGLEIERELYIGELSDVRNAVLPVAAAVGGMLVPGLFHFLFNAGTPTQAGFGIPMATDIAFALGILSLVGKSVPLALKIFLTALAIIDDLGAIIIIAIFYTQELQSTYLFVALGILAVLFVLNRLRVHQLIWYILGGILMWYCMLQSGVHATITGVLLAFVIPFGSGGEKMISYKLQHALHKPVAFFVVPLFAFANTGIVIQGSPKEVLGNSNSMGIMAGLLLGKPIGILLFSYMAIKTKIAQLPEGVNWRGLTGAGVLAGIGFTMSIFITLLAFNDPQVLLHSKLAILVSSLVAGILGFLILRGTQHPRISS